MSSGKGQSSFSNATQSLILRAFPNGVSPQERLALLVLLCEEMSVRAAAQIVAELVDHTEEQLYVEALSAVSEELSDTAELESVRAALERSGYIEWLAESEACVLDGNISLSAQEILDEKSWRRPISTLLERYVEFDLEPDPTHQSTPLIRRYVESDEPLRSIDQLVDLNLSIRAELEAGSSDAKEPPAPSSSRQPVPKAVTAAFLEAVRKKLPIQENADHEQLLGSLRQRKELVEKEKRLIVDYLKRNSLDGIQSLADLPRRQDLHSKLVPLLLQQLGCNYCPETKAEILRVLRVVSTPGDVGKVLVDLLSKCSYVPLSREVLETLKDLATDDDYENLLHILKNHLENCNRPWMVDAVVYIRGREAVPDIMELLDDGNLQVSAHSIVALGKLGAREARSKIEVFLHHSDPWIRNRARVALWRIKKNDSLVN